MKKTIIATMLSLSILASATPATAKSANITTKKVETCNLTRNMIEHRKGRVQLVEVAKGKCTSQKKDGRITNTKSRYNYISYRCVKGCHKGDTVITYLYYDINCNYCDCFSRRVDVVKCKHNHKTVKTDRLFLDDICK